MINEAGDNVGKHIAKKEKKDSCAQACSFLQFSGALSAIIQSKFSADNTQKVSIYAEASWFFAMRQDFNDE